MASPVKTSKTLGLHGLVTWGQAPTSVFLNEKLNYRRGFETSTFNATTASAGANQLEVTNSAGPGVVVDVVVAPPYTRNVSGVFTSSDGDKIKWGVIDAREGILASPGFTLQTTQNITWWKALRIRNDEGEQLCSLERDRDAVTIGTR